MSQDKEKEVSREEVIAWYKDQIELATLRADLAEQQNRAAKADAERIQATMFMAQVQVQSKEGEEEEQEEKAPVATLKRKK
jgi:hypothetical protein